MEIKKIIKKDSIGLKIINKDFMIVHLKAGFNPVLI